MTTIPNTIAFKKKTVYVRLSFYGSMILFLICGFIKSLNDYYDPLTILLLPTCIAVVLILLMKESLKLRNSGPLIRLSNEGIRFHGKYFDEIGIICWADITICANFKIGRKKENYLLIYVNNPGYYINRIEPASKQNYIRLRQQNNEALVWVNTVYMDCRIADLKRAIYKSINKKIVHSAYEQ